MGRVSEQVESLRIEITSNQNARTALASTHLDHRPKIANTDSHSTHTQHSPNIPQSPFPRYVVSERRGQSKPLYRQRQLRMGLEVIIYTLRVNA